MLKKSIFILMSALAFVSCSDSDAEDPGFKSNAPQVKLAIDGTFSRGQEQKEISRAVTTANLSDIITLPEVADLNLELYSVLPDGSEVFNSKWNSINDYQEGTFFRPGKYRLYAKYGNPDLQGENKPAFSGFKDFDVQADVQNVVSITSSLVNCFLSVNCTESFLAYFQSGNLTVKSGNLEVASFPLTTAFRHVFMTPGKFTCEWNGVRQGGKVSAKVVENNTSLMKTQYELTLDVDAGKGTMNIQFDDQVSEVAKENIVGDGLTPVEMPEMTPEGFVSAQQIECKSGTLPSHEVNVNILADGKIGTCKLAVDPVTAGDLGCDPELDLTSMSIRSLLKTKNVDIKGLDAHREKMAYVNLKGLIPFLSVGEHRLTLSLTDAFGRKAGDIVLSIKITA